MASPMEAAKILIHPDVSRGDIDAYAVRDGSGRSYLQTEQHLGGFGYGDRLVKKIKSPDSPAEVSYRLGLEISPSKWIVDHADPGLFDLTCRNLLDETDLTLTESGLGLRYQGRELFTISGGIPNALTKGETGETVIFEPDKEMYSFNFELESLDRRMPSVQISIGMRYNLEKLQSAYLFDVPFGSEEFYNLARQKLNAFIVIGLPRK